MNSLYFILPGGKASLRIWLRTRDWGFRIYEANHWGECGGCTVYDLGPITIIKDN
jgi:hypothetical protein